MERKVFKVLTSIQVYDVLGNDIATIDNEEKPAGGYGLEFSAIGGSASGGDAHILPSGIYFYRLQDNDFTQIKNDSLKIN